MKFVLFFFITLCTISITSHAGYSQCFPRRLKPYVTLFDQNDPEMLFNEEDESRFSHSKFEKAYMAFLTCLAKHPKRIEKVRWRKLIPLMRGIIAHSRYNDELMPLLSRIELTEFFRHLLHGFLKLYIKSKEDFEENFPRLTRMPQAKFETYLRSENDVILLGEIILFVCNVNREIHDRLPEIERFQTITSAHVDCARFRLYRMLEKQFTFWRPLVRPLFQEAQAMESLYYKLGSRFAVVGATMNLVESNYAEIEMEVANLVEHEELAQGESQHLVDTPKDSDFMDYIERPNNLDDHEASNDQPS